MATVLITGAGRGIGYELARQYASEGWTVFATCRDDAAASRLGELDGSVEVYELDVARPEAIAACKREIGERPIDVLVNNAGILPGEADGLGEFKEAALHEAMAVNAFAPLRMVETFADNVAASEHRKIISLSSSWASIGDNVDGGRLAYRSSKAALNALMRSAAIELSPRGICLIVVHPGWVQTDMGGSGAPVAVEDSVAALRELVESLTPEMSGRFYNYDGSERGW